MRCANGLTTPSPARWADPGHVFVNRYGNRFTPEQADAVVAQCCRDAGLPVVPLAGLRHPVWAG